jgi:ArsR family transcriptional regulator, arsenate/arsenite/antimonite-responsive transcriptional repressor / arsenate reductase (thioredoxin)
MRGERQRNARTPSGDTSALVGERARMHAALGEPVRLSIVDQLVLGDASPGELGEVVGLATNLLAFHLKVLEDAGLIRRVRSEGDRRRSYVHLRWEDPRVAALVSATLDDLPGAVPRVVFVCTHNSARSQLAAAAWARVSTIPAASAGTHPAAKVHPRAVATTRRHGLRIGGAGTHHVDDTVRPGDLIVAVCDNAHEELTAAPPADAVDATTRGRGWLHWAVPDPVRVDTDAAFDTAYTDLAHRVDRLAEALRTSRTAS